uniref:Islet amyloid polypeptide n=1 Tax=Naja naja TaxID=35670 RepID=A0A8C6X3U1_NAJNA
CYLQKSPPKIWIRVNTKHLLKAYPKLHHLDKRKCNTATCVTQRLADFLVRSSNTIGTIYAPTNVGSNTYGKRSREPPNYLHL